MATKRKTRATKKARAKAKAPRRRRRTVEHQLAFDAITIEGGILSPEWLARAAQLEAPDQDPSSYRIPKGLNLRDEIGRYWRIAQAHWKEFSAGREAAEGNEKRLRQLAERFVLSVLEECFGFSSLSPSEPVEVDGRLFPIGYAGLQGRVPVVVAPAGAGVDGHGARFEFFGDEGRRRNAFGLTQEYLNAEERALWGLCSDGLSLRLLRDNASLTRPAWISADLEQIFTEERFSDFTALWLVIHDSRFGSPEHPATECALERWRDAGREQGTRARDQLRHGVEDALQILGQGFLAHRDNDALRSRLHKGELTKESFFQQLLRLAYRLIFLLAAEERGVLHSAQATEDAKRLYAEGYGLRALRDRAVQRSSHDRFHDTWEGMKIVFGGLATGEELLGLPALMGLFAEDQSPDLDGARLANRAFFRALFRLSWLREEGGLARVNWRDMGPEELGSVYESLLEVVPQITEAGRAFSFATGAETKGHARKTTGSYYTPDSLVQVLLDSALEPVVERTIAEHPRATVEALLALSVVDPACGSGHFLLAAARRLAAHVARLEADGTPSATEYRYALRRVVGRCIYGVDLNPMAVELCKVSLWMEAVDPGLPLTFLDSHIRHGNALLGTTPELMAQGIPNDAWKPIEGDDKKTARALKNRNKDSALGQRGFETAWSKPRREEADDLRKAITALESAPDVDAGALAAKESRWQELLDSKAYQHQKFVADAWCAAFVWPKQPGPLAEAAPTNELWRQLRDGQGHPPELTVKTVSALAERYTFFHWHLAFPQVLARGGFDAVLGNPPWDSLLFREEEFFAASRPDIAAAPTAAARKRMVRKLKNEDPVLYGAYQGALRTVAGANAFVRAGLTYPLCGVGRVNLFGLFAERARSIVSQGGAVGQIVPSGLVTDDSTKLFFQAIMDGGELVSFFDFENREGIFAAVDSRMKFGLLTLAGQRSRAAKAEFVFFATRVHHVYEADRRFTLSAEDIALLNPATKTCPIFRSRRDAELTTAVYRRLPVLAKSGWQLAMRRLLNSADDSGNFISEASDSSLPLYEGKYFHQFEHRWVSNDGAADRPLTPTERSDPLYFLRPRYWYPADDARARFGAEWYHFWILAWRDIARSTDERTFISTVVPSLAVPHTAKVVFFVEQQVHLVPCFLGNACSFAFDFIARQKIGGTHMSAFIVEQLPLVAPHAYNSPARWAAQSGTTSDWLLPRVLELTYTAWDLEPFAHDVGHEGPPFRWDPERRFLLRAELDAAFFHLYGIEKADVDYIMETFPIVRRKDEKGHGEYRTKRVILEIYDEMADSARTGKPYQTRLDPPPADPRVAHPAREGGHVIPLAVRPSQSLRPAVVASMPDLVAVDTSAWVRPRTMERGEIQAAILAVLRSHGQPVDRRRARLAALLCLEPHLLLALTEEHEAQHWIRAVGSDAAKPASASIDATVREWGAALASLRGRGILIEDLKRGTWELGADPQVVESTDWSEGRASFVVNVLHRLEDSVEVDEIILKLPSKAEVLAVVNAA